MAIRFFFVASPIFLLFLWFGDWPMLPTPQTSSDQEAAESRPATEDADTDNKPELEDSMREAIKSFGSAFNNRDAAAFASHWSLKGESIAPDGSRLVGREQIEQEYATFFAANENVKIELIDSSVEFISPSIVKHTGLARITVGEQEPGETLFETIWIDTENGWKIDSLKEAAVTAPPTSNYDKLAGLEWMIGGWSHAGPSSEYVVNCRWTTNRNFIMRSYRVVSDGEPDLEGSEIIGWDPEKQVIRSWIFDSDGGFGAGVWSQQGNGWSVALRHVMPNGGRASSTNVYQLLSENEVEYSSIGRQVDDELLPSIGPIVVSRSGVE